MSTFYPTKPGMLVDSAGWTGAGGSGSGGSGSSSGSAWGEAVGIIDPGYSAGYVSPTERQRMMEKLAAMASMYGAEAGTQQRRPSNVELVQLRLFNEYRALPFDNFTVHRKSAESVVVFLVKGDNHVVLEDDGRLFPSDSLISRLRLLMDEPK